MNVSSQKRILGLLIAATVALGALGSGCKKSILRDKSAAGSGSFAVTAPVSCVITTSFPGYWRNTAAESLDFECRQNLGKSLTAVECEQDGSGTWGSCDSSHSHSLSGLSEGPHSFRVRARDQDGNLGHSLTLVWGTDTIAPTVDAVNLTQLNNNSPTLEFEGSDNAGGSGLLKLQCRLSSQFTTWQDCSSPLSYPALQPNTTYTAQVRAFDVAGNQSATPGEATFTTSAVTYTGWCAIAPQPPAWSRLKSQVMSFSCVSSSGISAVECRVDGSAWSACTTPSTQSMTGLAEGAHTFEVRYRDSANVASASDTADWSVDSVPPVVDITNASVSTLSPTFQFSASDSGGSGVDPATYQCRLESGSTVVADWTSCNSPKAYSSGIQAGSTYTFKARVSDVATNESNPTLYSWTATDGSKPSCVILTQFASPWRRNASETISYSCSSNNPNLTYSCLNKGNWVSCGASSFAVTGLASGQAYEFRVKATDNTGVEGDPSAPLSWTTDLIAPNIAVTLLTNTTPNASFNYVLADELGGSGPDNTRNECRVDNLAGKSSWHLCQSSYTGLAANQAYTLHARGYDRAGNVSAEVSHGFTSEPAYAGPTCILALQSGSNAPWTNQTSRAYSISCSGPKPISRIECSQNGSSWSTCTSPVTITSSTSGGRDIFVRGVDTDQMTGPVDTRHWNVDLAAINQVGFPIGAGTYITFSPSDTGGSGIATSVCRFEKGATVLSDWASCTSPFNHPDGKTAGASYTFRVKTTDAAGNTSAEANRAWTNGNWSDYGACSATSCGVAGIKTRTCTNPAPAGVGSNCVGSATISCATSCPAACAWGKVWSSATQTCVKDSCSGSITVDQNAYDTTYGKKRVIGALNANGNPALCTITVTGPLALAKYDASNPNDDTGSGGKLRLVARKLVVNGTINANGVGYPGGSGGAGGFGINYSSSPPGPWTGSIGATGWGLVSPGASGGGAGGSANDKFMMGSGGGGGNGGSGQTQIAACTRIGAGPALHLPEGGGGGGGGAGKRGGGAIALMAADELLFGPGVYLNVRAATSAGNGGSGGSAGAEPNYNGGAAGAGGSTDASGSGAGGAKGYGNCGPGTGFNGTSGGAGGDGSVYIFAPVRPTSAIVNNGTGWLRIEQ
jgi:hypothetical protein